MYQHDVVRRGLSSAWVRQNPKTKTRITIAVSDILLCWCLKCLYLSQDQRMLSHMILIAKLPCTALFPMSEETSSSWSGQFASTVRRDGQSFVLFVRVHLLFS